jgi:hypothetical protein
LLIKTELGNGFSVEMTRYVVTLKSNFIFWQKACILVKEKNQEYCPSMVRWSRRTLTKVVETLIKVKLLIFNYVNYGNWKFQIGAKVDIEKQTKNTVPKPISEFDHKMSAER